MTETVVVRVDRELKRKAQAYKLNLSDVVRAALRDEIEKRERQDLIASLEAAKKSLAKISDDDIVRAVRETRDER